MFVARLQRTMWHPMLQRCIALRSFQAVKGWRLYDEILERESFLSTIFTMDTLDHLKMVIPSGRFWLSRARRHARDVHAQTTMPTLEPKSKGIVAWAAIHLQQHGDTVQCSGRIHEWSWNWGSSDLLVPVFVEHDRSPHAERQALLTCSPVGRQGIASAPTSNPDFRSCCASCGAMFMPDAQFCQHCGSKRYPDPLPVKAWKLITEIREICQWAMRRFGVKGVPLLLFPNIDTLPRLK
eukprot:symbB.v1.2.015087.t3/scaffold1118.1/size136889/10